MRYVCTPEHQKHNSFLLLLNVMSFECKLKQCKISNTYKTELHSPVTRWTPFCLPASTPGQKKD